MESHLCPYMLTITPDEPLNTKPVFPYPPAQLLAIYLSSLARILNFHGSRYHLEAEYCTCMVIMLLEGWRGLPMFGGSQRFLKVANTILQTKPSSKKAETITHERLDLAQVRGEIFQTSPSQALLVGKSLTTILNIPFNSEI